MRHLIIYLLLLSTCLADSLTAISLETPLLDWKVYRFQTNCTLSYIKNHMKTYPGNFCLFLEDGSFISVNNDSIKRFSPSSKVLWEKSGIFHHQMNLSADKKRILVLKSEIRVSSGKRIRDDFIEVFDLNGNLVHRVSAMDILKQAEVTPLHDQKAEILKRFSADYETSHFNSIYEIPDNTYADKIPWMKTGNIIVNSYSLGIFILSPDLQKVLYHKELPFSNDHEFHDVQVTQKGEFLLFNNYRQMPGERDIPHSAIQKYDPVTDKVTFEFTSVNKEHFYSPACGGVQEFPEFIFFSHITKGGFFYSKEKKEIILAIPGFAGDSESVAPTQQIKIVDVREFLKNSY